MPRTARVMFPGFLYHVTQRGNNKQFIFKESADFLLYLKLIEEYRLKLKLDIFAYCIMGNHVHFVIRPNTEDGLARMFRSVNMRYAQYFQKRNTSSGHVWQGRFHSCLLSERHTLASIRYVERNPVRAGIVKRAWTYPWSSAKAHVTQLDCHVTLSNITEIFEVDDWRNFLIDNDEEQAVIDLKKATKKNYVLGSGEFIESIIKKRDGPF